jgi:hypothetical protein
LITDVLGRVLIEKVLTGSETETIFTADLPAGIYLITLIDKNQIRKVMKMVKQ